MLNVRNPVMMDIDSPSMAGDPTMIDGGKLWSGVKRRRGHILAWTLAFLALAIVYLLIATPMFLSTAEIIIDAQSNQILQKSDQPDATTIDTSLVDSQVEILSSDATARTVIRSLNLASDPEFVGPSSSVIGIAMAKVQDVIAGVMGLFGAQPGPVADPERRAVEAFGRLLTVKRTGLTYVITISFSSEDPAKAAKIANAVAEAYMDNVLDAKYASTKRAGKWLQDRLAEIRGQASEADRAVEVFKAANNIVDTNRGLMNQQQLSEFNTQLGLAKAATAEAKARVDRAEEIKKNPLAADTVSDAISNPVISRLRAQYLDLAAREGDLSARLGPNHYTAVALRNQMAEIKKSVQDEMGRISDGYQSDYKIALARELSIEMSLRGLISDSDTSSLAQVKLKDLESQADSYRALYNDYLQKYQVATQKQSFPIADARVVTEATEPLQKNSPKTLLVLAGGLLLGMMVGVASAFAGDMLSDSFVTPEDIEAHVGVPCLGVLPAIKLPKSAALLRRPGSAADIGAMATLYHRSAETHVLDAPFSRFAETMRNIKVSIDAMRTSGGDPSKVIAVTSSVPGEGKSTTAANLAQLVAFSGRRTLLVDCDLSTRALTARLAPDAKAGLLQSLSTGAPLSSLVVVDARTRLDFLPCVSPGRILNRADLMASAGMADFLAAARKTYEYIIIDLAPIVPVVDAKAAAGFIDCVVMVIEWQATSRKVVMEALSPDIIRQRVIGAVLNKVETAALQQLELYRGKGFAAYYTD